MDLTKPRITGPCRLTANGVDIGHTLDGVEFNIDRKFADVLVDKHGSTPIDKVLTGTELTIKVKLAQPDWYQWNLAMPETSSYDGQGTNDRVDVGGDVGTSLRQDAVQLVIHPLKNAPTNFVDDVTIYKAVSADAVPLPYKIDEQQVVEVTFYALVDESYGIGRRLGHIGPAAVS